MGGGGTSGDAVYTLRGTVGQPHAGAMTDGEFTVAGGFWSSVTIVQLPGASNEPPGSVVVWGDQVMSSVTSDTRFTAVSASLGNNLALTSAGFVVAWGDNGYGQSVVPAGLGNVVAVAAAPLRGLALMNNGTVVGWGYNLSGQLNVPPGLNNVVAIAAGQYHSLALKGDGTVVAWGNNNYGQATVPAGLTDVAAIAAGYSHNLALKRDGTVVAWSLQSMGQTNVPRGWLTWPRLPQATSTVSR